jgi:hypothetical protein
MSRLVEAGKSHEEMMTELQSAFPSATPQDIMRACQIGYDEICQWQEAQVTKLADLFGGGSDAELKAAMGAKPADALFPKPDKAKS